MSVWDALDERLRDGLKFSALKVERDALAERAEKLHQMLQQAEDYCRRHAFDEALTADTLRSCFADLAAHIAAPSAPKDAG